MLRSVNDSSRGRGDISGTPISRGTSISDIRAQVRKSLASLLWQGYTAGLQMQLGAFKLNNFQLKQAVFWTLIALSPALYCVANTADNFRLARAAGLQPSSCSASDRARPVNASEPLTKCVSRMQ